MTQDIGTAILRYQDFPEVTKMVYTVGNEQEYHFQVLFAILQEFGYDWAANCHHLSYGMVELPEGKMKSREGTVVDADNIMATMTDTARELTEELGKLEGLEEKEKNNLYEVIGNGALKYFLLKVDPKKNMLFNPVESIDFNGHTGPFIQYTYARIQSVLKNVGSLPAELNSEIELSGYERRLQQKIFLYSEIIANSATDYNPAHLANYIYELAKDFAGFYQNLSILKAETEALKFYRAALAKAVGNIIGSGMELLNIDVPEQM
jgi:arginyl-tRNA synthetase